MLTPRLKAVVSSIDFAKTLADIGTDHAYLPIESCRKNFCEKAIACDINKGPLEIAKINIKEAGLADTIETRLGDGLKPLKKNEADCIVITGMGGKRIISIIDEEIEKAKNAKLILQPQHDLEELRKSLHEMSFEIIEEKLIKESFRFYVIICAKFVKNITPWSESEYFLGKLSGNDLLSFYNDKKDKILRYINNINNEDVRSKADKQLNWIKEFIENENSKMAN